MTPEEKAVADAVVDAALAHYGPDGLGSQAMGLWNAIEALRPGVWRNGDRMYIEADGHGQIRFSRIEEPPMNEYEKAVVDAAERWYSMGQLYDPAGICAAVEALLDSRKPRPRYWAATEASAADRWCVFDREDGSLASSQFRVVARCHYQADAERITKLLNEWADPK